MNNENERDNSVEVYDNNSLVVECFSGKLFLIVTTKYRNSKEKKNDEKNVKE